MKSLRPFFAVTLAVVLSGCEVGPKYVRATAPTSANFKEQPPDSLVSGTPVKIADQHAGD